MGTLYIVPTPVGNMEDITLRALRVLKEADLILAEDTRTSSNLLQHYSITGELISHHKYNEHQTLNNTIQRIQNNNTTALISDAGTPAISDPGHLLVRECIRQGITVQTLPGPTAFVPALVSSGLPCDKFTFEGFLPQKKGRQTKLQTLKQQTHTTILYESPRRLLKTLQQLADTLGNNRQASVAREISKIHEEHTRGTLTQLIQHYQQNPPKGEIVITIAPPPDNTPPPDTPADNPVNNTIMGNGKNKNKYK